MQNEIDQLLNRLLVSWHEWSSRYKYGKGYPSAAVSCRPFRASPQYDSSNGVSDAALDDSIIEAFDAAAYRVPQPWLTALQFQARNMAGPCVWRSPRLPEDLQERAMVTMEARSRLLKELAWDGVIT